MEQREKVRKLIGRSEEFGREPKVLTSLRAELSIVRGMCLLARSETGRVRSHDITLAETAYENVLELARQVELTAEDHEAMQELGQEITSLGGHNFCQ